jgi:putative transposase
METKMTKKKRHTASEIAAKLGESANLAAAGQTQSEIARALGVSVMTFHRWRKAMPQHLQSKHHRTSIVRSIVPVADLPESERSARFAELQLENARLRKLVTDLLLEKMSLEDDAPHGGARSALNSA